MVDCTFIKERQTTLFMNPNGVEWIRAGDVSKLFTLLVVDCTFIKERQTTFFNPNEAEQSRAGDISTILHNISLH